MSAKKHKKQSAPGLRTAGYIAPVGLAFLVGLSPALLNFYVDPYELVFDRERTGKLAEIAEKAHYPLWKLGGYTHGAHETIVFGDSRARALREKYWDSLGLQATKNLAYGGGTIPEIYETYKHIKNDPAVKNLVIGIQLRSFDEDHKQGMNRVPEAISLIANPWKYAFNWSVAKTSFEVAKEEHKVPLSLLSYRNIISTEAKAAETESKFLGRSPSVHADLKSLYQVDLPSRKLPGQFARQVTRNAKSDWKGFEFSETYWGYIEEIGNWAKANDKKIVFVIPPTIVEMQQTINDYGLRSIDIQFRKRLVEFGEVLDFDYPDKLTKDLSNFTDAYHFNSKFARQIVGEVTSRLTHEKQILKRVDKRRNQVRCKSPAGDPSSMSFVNGVLIGLGSNCRVWSKTS